MPRNLKFVFIILGIILIPSGMLLAEENSSGAGGCGLAAVKSHPVGNKICPVMGEKIVEQEKTAYEYKGKIYNFCCSGCIEEFKKDPEKYIQIIDKEMAARGIKDKEGK